MGSLTRLKRRKGRVNCTEEGFPSNWFFEVEHMARRFVFASSCLARFLNFTSAIFPSLLIDTVGS